MKNDLIKITIGGQLVLVEAGKIIKLPPDIPHGLVAMQKSKMLLTMIK